MNTQQDTKQKTVAFYTLGCKVNQYDTEAVVEQFKESGYVVGSIDAYADVYVVNTCTVTHLSDRKCRQILRRTKRLNPNSTLVAMGCYAQSAGDKIKEEVEEVDLIVGTNRRREIVEMVQAYEAGKETTSYVEDIMGVDVFEELKINTMDEHTRVYLKIQEGCNNYCTYCIIPYVRGKIRSRQLENVIEEATRLAQMGFKEIVLTGIHLASYGKDLENITLIDAIQAVHAIEGIERIRLGSIEPVVVTDTFIEAIKALPKLCDHFHLSLQSGSQTVLKRMNRKYTKEAYAESVAKLRSILPDVAITTDIIVGFPGETEEEYQETLAYAREINFAQVHLFPYSSREGTVAAKMPNQVQAPIKEARVKGLKAITTATEQAFVQSHVGKVVEVLVEKQEGNRVQGHTTNYIKVTFETTEPVENTLCKVQVVTATDNHALEGVYVKA